MAWLTVATVATGTPFAARAAVIAFPPVFPAVGAAPRPAVSSRTSVAAGAAVAA